MNNPRAFGLADGALVVGVCLALFFSAWQFARTQVVWNDGVTQLAGLRLNPADPVRHLMHDAALPNPQERVQTQSCSARLVQHSGIGNGTGFFA